MFVYRIINKKIISSTILDVAFPCLGELHRYPVSKIKFYGIPVYHIPPRYYERIPRPKNPIQRPGKFLSRQLLS